MEKFSFTAPNNCLSECGVTIFGETQTVMVTELPDNPGMSITNASEKLATSIYYTLITKRFNWKMMEILWIEHYPDSINPGGSFDRVRYVVDYLFHGSPFYTNPVWLPSGWRPDKDKKSFEF